MEIAHIRDQIDIFNTELIGANFDLIAAQADLTRTDQRIANLKQAVQEHEEELSGQRVVFKVTDPVSGIPMEVTERELENVKFVFEMFVAFVAAAVSYAAIPGLAQAAWNTLKEGDLIEGQKGPRVEKRSRVLLEELGTRQNRRKISSTRRKRCKKLTIPRWTNNPNSSWRCGNGLAPNN